MNFSLCRHNRGISSNSHENSSLWHLLYQGDRWEAGFCHQRLIESVSRREAWSYKHFVYFLVHSLSAITVLVSVLGLNSRALRHLSALIYCPTFSAFLTVYFQWRLVYPLQLVCVLVKTEARPAIIPEFQRISWEERGLKKQFLDGLFIHVISGIDKGKKKQTNNRRFPRNQSPLCHFWTSLPCHLLPVLFFLLATQGAKAAALCRTHALIGDRDYMGGEMGIY